MEEDILGDLNSEKGLLSCLAQNPGTIIETYGIVSHDDFTNFNFRDLFRIFEILYTEHETHQPVFDLTSIRSASERHSIAPEFFNGKNGHTLIQDILKNETIDIKSLNPYIKNIKEATVRRALINETIRIKNAAQSRENTKLSAYDIIENALQSLSQIASESVGYDKSPQLLLKGVSDVIKENIANPKEELGFSMGFPLLDEAIQGLQAGRVYVVGARYKVGKTTFLLNAGLNVAKKYDIPVLFISTEMRDEEMMYRSAANLANIEEQKLRKGLMSGEEQQAFFESSKQYEKFPFYHIHISGYSIETVTSLIRRFIFHKVGLEENGQSKDCLVAFDYIKMPESVKSPIAMEKETQVLGLIMTQLKDLAVNLNFPLLTAAQENREGQLAASDRIGWFCDCELVLQNKSPVQIEDQGGNMKKTGNQTILIKASRNTRSNVERIDIFYDQPKLKMTEAPVQQSDLQQMDTDPL